MVNEIYNKYEIKCDFFFLVLQTCYHYGLVTVSDGKCRPQMTRLKLCPDLLVLQREEFIFPDDDDGYPVDNKVNYTKYILGH